MKNENICNRKIRTYKSSGRLPAMPIKLTTDEKQIKSNTSYTQNMQKYMQHNRVRK